MRFSLNYHILLIRCLEEKELENKNGVTFHIFFKNLEIWFD
jgi:hypothetical protein